MDSAGGRSHSETIVGSTVRSRRAIGDFAPKLVALTDEILFGDIWERPELAKRDRSLITVATLITSSSFEQVGNHLRLAKQNGST